MRQEMEYVWQVYQEKSFSKAADKLFISQPALSMAIRRLEDQLGMPIFDRSTRPLSLTAAGDAYLDYIRQTQFLAEEMEQRMEDIRNVNTGTIRLGGSHYLNAYILPDILTGFLKEYPNIQVELVENSSAVLSRMLADRQLDLTFNCNPRFMMDFERYPAFQDNMLLAVPERFPINGTISGGLTAREVAAGRHLLPEHPAVSLAAFQHTDFLLLNAGNNLHDRAMELFREAGFHPRVRLELAQLVTAYRLAAAGLGAAFISDRLVNETEDQLLYYKLDPRQSKRTFYMLLPNRRYTSAAVRRFIEYFEAAIG